MENESISMHTNLREIGGDIVLREVALGYRPVILIEPVNTEQDDGTPDVALKVDATGVTEQELIGILRLVIDILETGEEQ